MTTSEILEFAKKAKSGAATLSNEQKRAALINMAASLEDEAENILKANASDIAASNLSFAMRDRLMLNKERVHAMAENMRSLAKVPDPIGEIKEEKLLDNGLTLKKIAVPIGVIALVYENRPDVTADAAALTLKSGNVCVLLAGKESILSARAIITALRKGLKRAGVSQYVINFIEEPSEEAVNELMSACGYVDLLIPRGSAKLIKNCAENSKVPCIYTGAGICHGYVDEYADFNKALDIVENAKCERPTVCNAMEVLLINKKIAGEFLPELYKRLCKKNESNSVTLKLDEYAYSVLQGLPYCERAENDDFDKEFLDYVLAVKTVESVKEAVSHIALHSTGHSECIITENEENAKIFVKSVDSCAVYVNASTRLTDGGVFGLGAEIGISTRKIHARGPIGLKELTSYKYVAIGNGNLR